MKVPKQYLAKCSDPVEAEKVRYHYEQSEGIPTVVRRVGDTYYIIHTR
jgi:hypothetical protein